MSQEYLPTHQLSHRIKRGERTIRECMKERVRLEGTNRARPFGMGKITYSLLSSKRHMQPTNEGMLIHEQFEGNKEISDDDAK